MSQIKDIFLKWKGKKYLRDFLITLVFLAIMVGSFYFCVIGGRPNLIAFIIVVIICFTIITLFLARHIYIGLVMMIIGGLFGFLTDFWGVGNKVFIYREDIVTFYWLIKDITGGGVPIEIVLSYFFASMWLMQIIESIFDEEIEELINDYNSGIKLIKSYKQLLPAIIVIIISIIIIAINPILIQPWGYLSIGVFLTSLVPGNKKIIPIIFGILVGITGLFFELFCSGEIFSEAVIWTYNHPDWSFDTFYRAIIAYAGVGASLASIFLLLLKFPIFQKELNFFNLS
ncbi:MAG: hypothetical protein ACTSQJ_11325 [Promethearchaeota archaeon]